MSQVFSAYCWRNGKIQIGRKTPEKALCVGRGPYRALRRLVDVRARLAYDNKTRLVPGIPEAENDEEAFEAAVQFKRNLSEDLRA